MDCRLYWSNRASPSINKGPWTAEEDRNLINLVAKYNERHWVKIAQELQVLYLHTYMYAFQNLVYFTHEFII